MRSSLSETQVLITPQQAIQKLKDGNMRFVSGKTVKRIFPKEALEKANRPDPFAAILTCMDSRTSPELIFDQGIGDIFSMRIGANIVNEDILGSLEYTVKFTNVKLILVVGHTECQAITGACNNVHFGNLTALIAKIKPAIDAVPKNVREQIPDEHEFVNRVSEINVRQSLKKIAEESPFLKEMSGDKKIALAGAMYNVGTGQVAFYED